jgi:hypothetical protein
MPAISQNIIDNSQSTTDQAPSITAASVGKNNDYQQAEPLQGYPKYNMPSILTRLSAPPNGKYLVPGVILVVAAIILFFIYKKMK